MDSNVPNYTEQGGARTVIGGEINITGDLKIDGVVSNFKCGVGTLDGSNPTAIDTGLTTITSFVATLKGSTAPGVSTSVLTATVTDGTASVYAWKPTSSSDTTMVASTGTQDFFWIAIGE